MLHGERPYSTTQLAPIEAVLVQEENLKIKIKLLMEGQIFSGSDQNRPALKKRYHRRFEQQNDQGQKSSDLEEQREKTKNWSEMLDRENLVCGKQE